MPNRNYKMLSISKPTSESPGLQGCGPHGDCVRPNVCACAVGWEGLACDQCVPLPGCLDGRCLGAALECVCNRYDGDGRRVAAGDAEATTGQGKPRFSGSRCDIRESTVLDRVSWAAIFWKPSLETIPIKIS